MATAENQGLDDTNRHDLERNDLDKNEEEEVTIRDGVVPVREKIGIADEDFPDGGTRAWVCVFGSILLSVCCYGVLNSFGVFQEYYRVNNLKDRPIQDISWIGSLQLCLNLLAGCISGPLFDAGYFKHLIATGGALYVFCLMMTSISTEYYQYILAQGIGVGLSAGLIFTPGIAVLAHHFKRHRNLVYGLFAAGASVGGAVLPIAMQRLLREVGFGWTLRILGFIVLACVSTAFVCCNTRLPPRRGGRVLDIRVFKDIPYLLLVLGAGVVSLGLYVPLTYGITYAISRGMDQQLAFYSLSILNAFSIIGRTVPNVIAQRFGAINVLIVACTIASLMLFLFTTARSQAAIITYDAFYGVCSGSYVSVVPAAVSSMTLDAKETGLRLGMIWFTTSFFWLASSPSQGALIRTYGFLPASIFSGTCVAAGVGLILASRWFVVRATGSQRV